MTYSYLIKFKWALIAQHMKTGEMKIWSTFPIDRADACDTFAETLMKTYPWVEAACFLVY